MFPSELEIREPSGVSNLPDERNSWRPSRHRHSVERTMRRIIDLRSRAWFEPVLDEVAS